MRNNETLRLPLDNLSKICKMQGMNITDILDLKKDS
nr:helix-turn-helix domain-containing protein [Brevibacillus laterosporus]